MSQAYFASLQPRKFFPFLQQAHVLTFQLNLRSAQELVVKAVPGCH